MSFTYPDGKRFIFTIFDDTDVSTLEYIRPIYEFLYSLGIRITKSVWPISYEGKCNYSGSHTLEDKEYADYVRLLTDRGFEIAFHGPRMVSSTRGEIERSFEVYNKVLGQYPSIYAPHSLNRENLYWGSSRFTFFLFRVLYRLFSGEEDSYYQGHVKGSPFFWGDLSLRHIDYVRNFTFSHINLLNISATLPYSNENQPWVKSWFFSADSDNAEEFNRLLCEKNQEQLEREAGVCIISTHFGKGFVRSGQLRSDTKILFQKLRKRNGWFVPVSTALKYLESKRESTNIGNRQLFNLELKWFLQSLVRRFRRKRYDKTEIDYLEGKSFESQEGIKAA